MYHHRMNTRLPESGNVLFYILIAVALIAALSFAVVQSGGGGTKSITDERARLIASEIIEYSNVISAAVSQLKLRGCEDTEISFENDVVTTYANPNAPADEFCNVFSISGGGVQWRNPEVDWLDATLTGNSNYAELLFTGKTCIQGFGPNDCVLNSGGQDAELLFIVPYLKLEVCNAINKLLDRSFTTPPLDGANSWQTAPEFIGSYAGPLIIYNATDDFENKHALCMRGKGVSTPQNYAFYRVLIGR